MEAIKREVRRSILDAFACERLQPSMLITTRQRCADWLQLFGRISNTSLTTIPLLFGAAGCNPGCRVLY